VNKRYTGIQRNWFLNVAQNWESFCIAYKIIQTKILQMRICTARLTNCPVEHKRVEGSKKRNMGVFRVKINKHIKQNDVERINVQSSSSSSVWADSVSGGGGMFVVDAWPRDDDDFFDISRSAPRLSTSHKMRVFHNVCIDEALKASKPPFIMQPISQ